MLSKWFCLPDYKIEAIEFNHFLILQEIIGWRKDVKIGITLKVAAAELLFLLSPINNNITQFVYFRGGYVEHSKRPGERVSSFKLSDVENNNLAYVDQGASGGGGGREGITTVSFQAWDGEDYSQPYQLKIKVI